MMWDTGFAKLNWKGQVAWCILYLQQSQAALAVVTLVLNSAANLVILFHISTRWAILLNVVALPFAIAFGWVYAHHGPTKSLSELPFLDGLDTRSRLGLAIGVAHLEQLGINWQRFNPDEEIRKVERWMTALKVTKQHEMDPEV